MNNVIGLNKFQRSVLLDPDWNQVPAHRAKPTQDQIENDRDCGGATAAVNAYYERKKRRAEAEERTARRRGLAADDGA